MNKFELAVVLKLIDLHTVMRNGVYGNDYPEIKESGIKALKKDLTELFENENDNERKETV